MSQLILSWLNNQLHLSQPITSFQRDFSNGYLFGEILAKYNQQLNFSSFINKTDRDSKLNNFNLLYETFKSLRISLTFEQANEIIEQQKGKAKQILYQLKMQLQHSTSTLSYKTQPLSHKAGLTPLKKIQVGKQKKDQLDSKLFRRGLQIKHRAQKKINEQQALRKFSDFHQEEKQKQKLLRQQEMREIQMRNQHLRSKMRTDFKRVQEFSRQWEKEGNKNWEKNMEVRKNQSAKDGQYRVKMGESIRMNGVVKEERELKQVTDDIDEFEGKFGKEERQDNNDVGGLDDQDYRPQYHQKSSIQFTSKILNPSKPQSHLKRSPSYKSPSSISPSPNQPLSSTTPTSDPSRKQRDKKRRMMIVNQSKHQSLIQLQRRQQQLLFNLHQISKQEKQIEYEIWRARQNKMIIVENRRMREGNYQEKEEVRRVNKEWRMEELLRVEREEHGEDVGKKVEKFKGLGRKAEVGERKEVYEELEGCLGKLLEVVERCYQYEQDGNSGEIEGAFFDGLMEQFIQHSPKQLEQHSSCIDSRQLQHYLSSTSTWSFTPQRLAAQPTDPTLQSSLPASPVNNYHLANIIKTIYEKYFPEGKKEEVTTKVEFGMCLLGLECSGKRTVAKHIGEMFGLKVIDPEEVLKEVMRKVMSEEELTGQERRVIEISLAGGTIPDPLLFHFISFHLSHSPRFLLLNYPLTYSQSLLLTHHLSHITPSDHSPPTPLSIHLSSLHQLVQSTPSTITPWQIKPCGIDLVLWLDLEGKKSVERYQGMRRVEGMEVHVMEEGLSGVNVSGIKRGNEGRSVIERNSWVERGKREIKEWFGRFGVKVGGEGEESVCWKEVNSNGLLLSTIQDSLAAVYESQQLKLAHSNHLQQQSLIQSQQQQALALQSSKKQQLRKLCTLTPQTTLQSQLALALTTLTLKPQFISLWSTTYPQIHSHLISSYLFIFKNLRLQKQSNLTKLANQKRRFLSQLTRQDKKFQLLKKFQLDYNQFVSANKDMVQQSQTKQQLHQRVDDLEDRITQIIDSKRTDCQQQRTSFISSNWLQSQLQYLFTNIHTLTQIELERTMINQQIIGDYYAASCSLESGILGEIVTDVQVDGGLELIGEGEFPRLEKLIGECMRVFNREEAEVVDDKGKKGGKVAVKKEDKKQPKKNAEVQAPKQVSKEEQEMITALNIEKSIFRYRLNIIKQFARQQLLKLKSQGQMFYKEVEKLIIYTEKTQLAALQKLSGIAREYIEEQGLIQKELQINVFDVYIHHNLLNFQDPKPIIKPSKQLISPTKFTIGNLAYMINNLLQQGERFTKRIANHKLLTVLVRTTNHRQTCLRLPEIWRGHSFEDYDVMIRNLDFGKTGFVLLDNLFVFFVLCNMRVPGKKELGVWKERLLQGEEGKTVSKEKFIGTESWFDESEKQPEEISIN